MHTDGESQMQLLEVGIRAIEDLVAGLGLNRHGPRIVGSISSATIARILFVCMWENKFIIMK